MKLLIFLLLFFFSITAFSQNDILVLKQKNQTIQTWLHGSIINFQYSNGQWVEAIIKSIKNDSLFLDQILVHQVANQFGFPSIDTGHLGLIKIPITDIYGVPRRGFGADIFTNGALVKLGSGAYIFLNIINSLIHNEPVFASKNLLGLGIASGAYAIGCLMSSNHKSYIQIGKKYKLSTIVM